MQVSPQPRSLKGDLAERLFEEGKARRVVFGPPDGLWGEVSETCSPTVVLVLLTNKSTYGMPEMKYEL